ncbi:MAG: exonuclease SbcCD subunit D [bacterium]
MKILHTADWHIGKDWNGVNRTEDFIDHVIPEIVTIAKSEQVELVIVAGDLLDGFGRDSLKHCARLLRKPIKELLEAHIHVAIIPGNHDNWPLFRVLDSALGINPLSEKGRLLIFTEPAIHQIAKIQIIGMPYLGAHNLGRLITQQGLKIPVEPDIQANALSIQYEKILTELKAKLDYSRPAVLIGHFSVGGAKLSDEDDSGYPGYETSYPRELRISREALLNSDQTPQYNALGHIHLGQSVRDTVALTCYSGAPDRLDLGDENYEPHVLIVELPEKSKAAFEKVYLKSATPFIRKTISSADELAAVARKIDAKLHPRVLGRIKIQVELQTDFISLRDAVYDFFPRLKKARTVTYQSSDPEVLAVNEADADYVKFSDPGRMFEEYFKKFPTDKIPTLKKAIDTILSEIGHDN